MTFAAICRVSSVGMASRGFHSSPPMPVFIAFAAFLLLVFGHRLGLPIAPWVVSTGPFANKRKTPGQKSGVRTQVLEMVLDQESGRMEGRCLKGRFVGRLSQSESLQLLEELRSSYWKRFLIDAGRDGTTVPMTAQRPNSPRGGGMTANEAYELLEPGAKPDEIRTAHRRLMMKFHPDQGGSTYLAARINEAKEILLSEQN